MRRPVTGEVRVDHRQLGVQSGPDAPDAKLPDLVEAFAGQEGGLCGGAVPGALRLHTGLYTGAVGFTVEVHDGAPPPADPVWEDVVEVSFRPASEAARLVTWAGEEVCHLDLALTDYRVRYCARGMDAGRERDTGPAGEAQTDSYLLQFWPAQPAPDRVVRQTSEIAAQWHRYARGLPPRRTPEQRAEDHLALRAEERAAREWALRKRWEWGGRLPERAPHDIPSVRGLLGLDSDLLHALDDAGPEAQRAVARLAARRACEELGLTALPWIAGALTALAEERPLPPPFDDEAGIWKTWSPGSRSPEHAAPHGRPPYCPPPRPALRRRGPDRGLGERLPGLPTHEQASPLADARHAAGTEARAAGRTRRAHELAAQSPFALLTVLAAAEPDPLRAAVDTLWYAVTAYGEHYPELLAEVRAAVPRR